MLIAAAAVGSLTTPGDAVETRVMSTAVVTAHLAAPDASDNVSRGSGRRTTLNGKLASRIKAKMNVVTDTAIRADHNETAPVVETATEGSTVSITAQTHGPWSQIIYAGERRWVLTHDLAVPEDARFATDASSSTRYTGDDDTQRGAGDEAGHGGGSGATSMAPCAAGSGVESGLMPDTVRVHRAVCAKFGQVRGYGGRSGGGDHATGRALDIMVGGAIGDQIAAYVRSHAKELGVSQVIWQQRIWTVQRASQGWRPMPDRGGATANHMDHVHVSTYGNRGTAG